MKSDDGGGGGGDDDDDDEGEDENDSRNAPSGGRKKEKRKKGRATKGNEEQDKSQDAKEGAEAIVQVGAHTCIHTHTHIYIDSFCTVSYFARLLLLRNFRSFTEH